MARIWSWQVQLLLPRAKAAVQRATTPFQAPTCPYNLPTRLSPPTCRRPRVIYPLDGCFVLIYLESGAAVLATSLITATQATSHRPTVDSRQVLRTRSETRLEGGSATKASRTWSSHQQVGKQEMLISPRIPHRRRSRSGSTLAPVFVSHHSPRQPPSSDR